MPTVDPAGPVVVHVVAEYSVREAIGRTIAEAAARVPGVHHLVAARVHDGHERFASVHELGGSLSWFTFGRARALAAALDEVSPDLVHVHGGPLSALASLSPALRGRAQVHTVYAWPRLPRRAEVRRNGTSLRQLRSSNVVRPRVAVTTVVGPRIVGGALRRAGCRGVLTPDPTVVERLRSRRAGDRSLPVTFLPSGAAPDPRRARFREHAPTVVFAGRAEHVRGITTLLDAFRRVRVRVPGARLRLLLLPTPELPEIVAAAAAAGTPGTSVETGPIDDLLAELASAQVGAWPFHYDSTTSPPAMALAEAMSVGLPVVSTPVACVRAVARPGSGVALVPTADAEALADAISDLLLSRDRWDAASHDGLAAVASCSWASAAEATSQLYAGATGSSPSAPTSTPTSTAGSMAGPAPTAPRAAA